MGRPTTKAASDGGLLNLLVVTETMVRPPQVAVELPPP
jgi:hypothetical protein